MAIGLPPPPTTDATGSFAWLEWFRQLRNYISTAGSVPWSILDFTGSNLTDIVSRSHQNLQSLQGGATGEYYHLSQAEYEDLTDGGATTLHTHAGLGGGDLMSDGTVPLTANWDAGSFEIRSATFESDVATGTAPLVVASTTKVTNLNADKLDDQEGSYYLDSTNFTGANWTDLTDGGSTTLHTHPASSSTDTFKRHFMLMGS